MVEQRPATGSGLRVEAAVDEHGWLTAHIDATRCYEVHETEVRTRVERSQRGFLSGYSFAIAGLAGALAIYNNGQVSNAPEECQGALEPGADDCTTKDSYQLAAGLFGAIAGTFVTIGVVDLVRAKDHVATAPGSPRVIARPVDCTNPVQIDRNADVQMTLPGGNAIHLTPGDEPDTWEGKVKGAPDYPTDGNITFGVDGGRTQVALAEVKGYLELAEKENAEIARAVFEIQRKREEQERAEAERREKHRLARAEREGRHLVANKAVRWVQKYLSVSRFDRASSTKVCTNRVHVRVGCGTAAAVHYFFEGYWTVTLTITNTSGRTMECEVFRGNLFLDRVEKVKLRQRHRVTFKRKSSLGIMLGHPPSGVRCRIDPTWIGEESAVGNIAWESAGDPTYERQNVHVWRSGTHGVRKKF